MYFISPFLFISLCFLFSFSLLFLLHNLRGESVYVKAFVHRYSQYFV